MGLQQIVQPTRPGPFFPGHMQLTPQTVDELQNAAGFGFDNGLHHQLATAVEHGDHGRFLVHVHADILDVATHAVASLRERSLARNGSLSLKVKCHSSAHLPIFSLILALHPAVLHSTRPLSHNALARKKANEKRKLATSPVYDNHRGTCSKFSVKCWP